MRSNRSRKKNTRRNKNRRTYRRKSPNKRINRKRYSNKKRTGRRRINSKRRGILRGGAPPECTFRSGGWGGCCADCGGPEYHPNHIHEFEGKQGGYVFDELYCKHCNKFMENIIHIFKHNYDGLVAHLIFPPCRVCGKFKDSIVHNIFNE